MLAATGESELVEANSWVVYERTGDGKNRLGRILMRVREEIVEEGVILP